MYRYTLPMYQNYEKFASGVLDFAEDSFKIKKDDFKEE